MLQANLENTIVSHSHIKKNRKLNYFKHVYSLVLESESDSNKSDSHSESEQSPICYLLGCGGRIDGRSILV